MSTEKKIEKLKADFILALKDISKSVELNSEIDENGYFVEKTKEELKIINKLRGRMKKAYDISLKLKEINRLKDLHYLLEDSDSIVVTYYCKAQYPNYADVFIPILLKLYRECQIGPYAVEIGSALREFGAPKEEIEKIQEEIRQKTPRPKDLRFTNNNGNG